MSRLKCLVDFEVEKSMGFNGLEFRWKAQAREISLIIICTLAMRLDEIAYQVRVDGEEFQASTQALEHADVWMTRRNQQKRQIRRGLRSVVFWKRKEERILRCQILPGQIAIPPSWFAGPSPGVHVILSQLLIASLLILNSHRTVNYNMLSPPWIDLNELNEKWIIGLSNMELIGDLDQRKEWRSGMGSWANGERLWRQSASFVLGGVLLRQEIGW